ncbi:hypothetical protein [Rhodococcus koreensis]
MTVGPAVLTTLLFAVLGSLAPALLALVAAAGIADLTIAAL